MRAMGIYRETCPPDDGCVGCGGTRASLSDGLMVCPCGVVRGRYYDSAPESSRDGVKDRHGCVSSALYPGAGCYMVSRTSETRRAIKMQAWAQTSGGASGHRDLYKNLTVISAEAHGRGLCESVATRAKHLYAGLSSDPFFRGTRRAGLVEGCLYVSMKGHGASRTPAELGADKTVLTGVKRVMAFAALDVAADDDCCACRAYLERHAGAAGLAPDVAERALVVAGIVDGAGVVPGFKPATRAAASVLIAAKMCGSPAKAAAKAAEALGVCASTAARCVKAMRPFREQIEAIALKVQAAPAV